MLIVADNAYCPRKYYPTGCPFLFDQTKQLCIQKQNMPNKLNI